MPTTYTTSLGLALPATGELSGTWGTTVNDYITKYLDAAVAGTQTLSTDADVTLTTTNGSNLGSTSAQYAILNCTGARTVQRTITVPAASKSYLVINATTGGQSIKVVGAGPTTGVTLANGERALIAWNGSDFVKVGTNFAAGGSDTQVQYNSSGALAGSANLTFNGTTLTANALAVSTGNLTFSGTAQRITGDMSNATVANRLAFQTSTANSSTSVNAIPSGTGTTANIRAVNNSTPTNASFVGVDATATEAQIVSGVYGTGTNLPMTFYTGGSEAMRIQTSGNVGIGTASPGAKLEVVGSIRSNSGSNVFVGMFDAAGAVAPNTFVGLDYDGVNSRGRLDALSGGVAWRDVAINSRGGNTLLALGGGNVGIGTASPTVALDVVGAAIFTRNGKPLVLNPDYLSAGTRANISTGTGMALAFSTNGDANERMRITAAGNIVAGASAALATTATDGFLYVPTCAGTPTGTPTAITGMAPIVVNTTNNKLYFYSGGAWRDAGP